MPYCKSCAAPLPAYTSRCEYCGVKNDVDLQGISEFTVSQQHSDRRCPLCNIPLETISLKKTDNFSIERCPTCMGLFFDPDELNALLDKSIEQVYSINLKKIWTMNQMESRDQYRARAYIKCPVCGELMNRVNFGARSGAVVDQCRHGIWLDNGELRKLLEWRKAGGKFLHEQIMSERAEREKKERKEREKRRYSGDFTTSSPSLYAINDTTGDLPSLLASMAKVVWRLFE
ncbi:MAG: zf-TFIIB domain-containing protein [Chitinispirillaceae bacterium]|nr:zf-TFIIB domain-containing protein [Chitinispirillaceae bacterium]